MISIIKYLSESQAWQRQNYSYAVTPLKKLGPYVKTKAGKLMKYQKNNPDKQVTSPQIGTGHISSYDVDKDQKLKTVAVGSKKLDLRVNQER